MKKILSLILLAMISAQCLPVLAKEAEWVNFVPSFARGFIPEHAKQEKSYKECHQEADWVKCVPPHARGFIPDYVKTEQSCKKVKSKKNKDKKNKAATESVIVDVKSSNFGFQDAKSTGDVTRFGMVNTKGESISGNLTVMGYGTFRKLSIGKDCDIRGDAQFDKAVINGNLLVLGHLTGDDITVKGSSTIYGYVDKVSNLDMQDLSVRGSLKAQSSTFKNVKVKKGKKNKDKKNLEVVLKKCTLSSLVVKSKKAGGYIELHDTTINGDVTFSKEPVCVKLFGTSKIEGKIVNGTVEIIK